jgi:hypothetical protein
MALDNRLNNNLVEYIKYYQSLNNPQFAILINGKWGSGKTFFIKKQVEQWNLELEKNKKAPKEQKKTTWFTKKTEPEPELTITLKPIYISLYGVSKTSEINNKIKEALSPLLYSKGAKIVKNILLGVVKTATHVNFDTDGDGKSDGKISFDINSLGLLKGVDSKITGDKMLVFDDLERCKIKISELFGYVNEYVEHYNCKVILLCDEKKIIDKCKKEKDAYLEFKEKLVGQTFIIQPDVEMAIVSFTNKLKDSKEQQLLTKSKDLIKSVFEASKFDNLRTLRQAILDFERFVQQFDTTITSHNKYDEFLNSLLGHFILVYLENKSGNLVSSKIPKYAIPDEQNEERQKLNAKYTEVLDKCGVSPSQEVIRYERIVEFINNGFSDILSLNKVNNNNNSFFRKEEVKDWEKLWAWEEIDDDEFKILFKRIHSSLEKEDIENPYELLQVISIIISLNKNGIIDLTELDLVGMFKKQFEGILEKNHNETFARFDEHSWGKVYREKESDEVKEILLYANERVLKHNSQNKDDYLKQVFENINDENVSEIQDKLDSPLSGRRSNYSFGPILTTVNGENLATSLLKLNNANLQLFFYFLSRRYFPEEIYSNGYLEPFNAQDKECFIDIKNKIGIEMDSFPEIKRHNLKIHISFLGRLIDKLDKLGEQ